MKRFKITMAVVASAALLLSGCGGDPAGPRSDFDPNAPVTLDLAFWGNDTRAGFYQSAIAKFNEKYPNITVNSTFLAFPEFWEKRQIEAAGRDLPDVMQFDYAYLRQYSQNRLLLDLKPYLGKYIKTDGFTESTLGIGVVNGVTTALPVGTNAWAMFTNTALLGKSGGTPYAGGTSWDEYATWMGSVTKAGGGAVWGGTDPTGRIQNFEITLRANGKNLFDDAGAPQFTKAELTAFWSGGAQVRGAGATIPTKRLLEVAPKSGFGAGLTASELTWDNFGAGYAGDLGADASGLALAAPPVTKAGAKDLYLKPSMLHAIAANSEHPEAAALLVDFLVNSQEAGEVFGTNRGLPASSTHLAGVKLDPLSQKILDYETSIKDRLGQAPPVPVVGYGSIEEKFRQLGEELGLGTVTVEQAVDQFFSELDTILKK
ncbi:ABC transporter substrate-binding protein [Catellatospora coxensis]|uniref:Sugar ABC transporter substrate-binding protein n=1 Tax=Catellatospora coxensis TaxID=310354 RepID=A0A8J3P760_9ACTN|nr:extracellular solute-binding protein [Catellatospora coxensis]GIG06272.1 sugar ABC transporter substrate-binding protein [Catellatospora coxensis]